MDCDEPRPAPNEKTQPIQWIEQPTGALVAVGSLWPRSITFHSIPGVSFIPSCVQWGGAKD
jgi:hypothetical protein